MWRRNQRRQLSAWRRRSWLSGIIGQRGVAALKISISGKRNISAARIETVAAENNETNQPAEEYQCVSNGWRPYGRINGDQRAAAAGGAGVAAAAACGVALAAGSALARRHHGAKLSAAACWRQRA